MPESVPTPDRESNVETSDMRKLRKRSESNVADPLPDREDTGRCTSPYTRRDPCTDPACPVHGDQGEGERVTLWRFTDAPSTLGLNAWQQERVGTRERLADKDVEFRDFIPADQHKRELGAVKRERDFFRKQMSVVARERDEMGDRAEATIQRVREEVERWPKKFGHTQRILSILSQESESD